jgi:Zn-dependent protease with chaperone function
MTAGLIAPFQLLMRHLRRAHAPRLAFRLVGASCLVAFAGCAVNPHTGRSQLIALPAAQIAHAELSFSLAKAAGGLGRGLACATDSTGDSVPTTETLCATEAELARFVTQVKRVGEELAAEARQFSPDLFTRISDFQIGVISGAGAGTASSAGGQIVLASELASLDPTDDVVAFLIAREMGHVIARHGEEAAGARIAFSALTAIVPLGGLIVRFAASFLGSQAVTSGWAEGQRRDADELALALLARTARSTAVIALNLRVGLKRERLPEGEWSAHFLQSVERVEAVALALPKQPLTVARRATGAEQAVP